jgi:hypothetical protein
MAPVIMKPTSAPKLASSALRRIINAPGVLKTKIVQDMNVIDIPVDPMKGSLL